MSPWLPAITGTSWKLGLVGPGDWPPLEPGGCHRRSVGRTKRSGTGPQRQWQSTAGPILRIGLASALQMEAIGAALTGDTHRAAGALLAGLQVGRTLEFGGLYIDYLVRVACDSIATQATEGVFSRLQLTDAQLEALQKAFLRAEGTNALGSALIGERAYGLTSRTGCAVERFRALNGRLPSTLDELVPGLLDAVPTDPGSGESLKYRRLDRGYVVYCLGEDGTDDGGAERANRTKGAMKGWDDTFTVER